MAVQLKEEGEIYEDVNEDEYQEIVKKRREDEFIEDDGAPCRSSSPWCGCGLAASRARC